VPARRPWLPTVAAYLCAVTLAALLAVRVGAAPSLPALAPLTGAPSGEIAAGPPPAWAYVRLRSRPGAAPGRWLLAAVTVILGGYAPTPEAILASVFPGLPPLPGTAPHLPGTAP